jgi:hypothetical protein
MRFQTTAPEINKDVGISATSGEAGRAGTVGGGSLQGGRRLGSRVRRTTAAGGRGGAWGGSRLRSQGRGCWGGGSRLVHR